MAFTKKTFPRFEINVSFHCFMYHSRLFLNPFVSAVLLAAAKMLNMLNHVAKTVCCWSRRVFLVKKQFLNQSGIWIPYFHLENVNLTTEPR